MHAEFAVEALERNIARLSERKRAEPLRQRIEGFSAIA
jgi:DNA-directed RNA polymerase specialized sigma24 family protein